MATYRQLQESLGIHEGVKNSRKEAKPGDTWQTDSGNWYGMRIDKDTKKPESQSYGPEGKEKANVYAKGGDPDKVDGGEKDEKEPKPEGEKPEKLDPEELKSKLVDKDVSKIMNYKDRITDLKTRAEIENENKEDAEEVEALKHIGDSIEELDGSFKDRAALLQTVGFLFTGRKNARLGKNNLGIIDRDQLNKNKETLLAGYDDAIPEKVEKYVRSVRPHKVPERFVRDSFSALPEKFQDALKRKGKVGDVIDEAGGHFLGYKAVNPKDKQEYTTSDHDDPNIQKGKDGKPEVVRGNTGTTSRALSVWRIYIEQGGVDAYTGLPLDLEEMDLEHVVGFQNKDKGKPTGEDYANREHEANQVLCSSRANQQKTDLSMKDFFEQRIDPLKDKSPEDFTKIEKGFEEANEITSVAEQTALALQGDAQYKLKGGGVTTNPDDPNVKRSENGVPQVEDATLDEKITPKILQQYFQIEEDKYANIKNTLLKEGGIDDPKDKKKIGDLKSKIGRRTVQAMGLPRGMTDVSGRRSNPVYSTDTGYRTFLTAMAAKPYKERQVYKDTWKEGIKLVGGDEVRALAKDKKASQKDVFEAYIRGNVKELKGMGVKLDPETENRLKERGNIIEEQVKPQYESLEGTISRMVR
jgi:hypothetical protein